MAAQAERLQELIGHARVVLWDFDGPICRLFAGHAADGVANDLVEWLAARGLRGLLTEGERETPDPHVVLRAVDRRHPASDLVTELEERLTQEELRAVPTALPTAFADPLIRTWKAVGARLAIATNNSPEVVRAYLTSRHLLDCFMPHIYGRTHDLQYLKPHPHYLNRALTAMGAAPPAPCSLATPPPTARPPARPESPSWATRVTSTRRSSCRTRARRTSWGLCSHCWRRCGGVSALGLDHEDEQQLADNRSTSGPSGLVGGFKAHPWLLIAQPR